MTMNLCPIHTTLKSVQTPRGFKLDRFSLFWDDSRLSSRVPGATWRLDRPGQPMLENRILFAPGRASERRQEACRIADTALHAWFDDLHAATGMRAIFAHGRDIGSTATHGDAIDEEAGHESTLPRADLLDPSCFDPTAFDLSSFDPRLTKELLSLLALAAEIGDGVRPIPAMYGIERNDLAGTRLDRAMTTCFTLNGYAPLNRSMTGRPMAYFPVDLAEACGFPGWILESALAEWDAFLQLLLPAPAGTLLKLVFAVSPGTGHERLAAGARLVELETRLAARYAALRQKRG